MTKCRNCDVILTEENHSKTGYVCRSCWNIYCREYKKNNQEKIKAERRRNREKYIDMFLRRRYGITLEEKRQMWRDQDGKCALCGKELLKSKDCNVDHDHKTGIVRRLLCSRCNVLMAAVDEVAFLQRAIAYRQEYLPDNHPEKITQKIFPANKRTVPVFAPLAS
jgi:hypothetical protein